jgi:hypothetical protein
MSRTSVPRARRLPRLIAAAALVVGSGLAGVVVLAPTPAVADATSSAVTKSVTIERHYINADGTTTQVTAPHSVSLTVDQTAGLRSFQLVHVSWTGAHQTGGLVGDQNSDLAQNEEYPMVLLECRGVDSPTAPAGQQMSPQTCWTQYADERFDYCTLGCYPAWRADANAAASDRQAFVNQPSPLPQVCSNALYHTAGQYWLPFAGADGTTYAGGIFACAGQPAEAAPANVSSQALPSNETYGVTGADGTGETNFDIFTAEDHNSLGCSQTVQCSLVAIPVEGLDCDPYGTKLPVDQQPTPDQVSLAQTNCENTGHFPLGQILPVGQSGYEAVDGALWWAASNWANRIVVPLGFAPPDNACGLVTTRSPLLIYGSELLSQATTSWGPKFCLDPSLFNFTHVRTSEPQAASLLTSGSIEGAYISDPPPGGFTAPTVTAPVSVTGFGIAFTMDDTQKQNLTHLNLTPRLLAKLLTESYPDIPLVQSTDSDLANNPLNLSYDPEFMALNPNIQQKVQDAAASLLALNSDSDVMYALTSYINADPDARAWLDGTPDPWGMTVNPNYKGIQLPVDNWPLLDSFKPAFAFQANPCFYSNPVPFLPLVAAPTANLFNIGQDLQFALVQAQTVCVIPDPSGVSFVGAHLVSIGRQQTGARFMLGVVSLGDAARNGLTLASLETQKSSGAPDKFTDGTGRTFVAPTSDSLETAAKALVPDATTNTWPIPYDKFRSDPANAQAYPGTMLVYQAVPTSGLPATDASQFAQLMTYAAGAGQVPGVDQGQLPAGYLPMTSANGLATMVSYTQRAAAAVAAQKGDVPLVTGGSSSSSSGSSSGGSHPSSGQSVGGSATSTPAPPQTTPSSAPSTAKTTAPSTPAQSSSPTTTPAAQLIPAPKISSTMAGLALPLLLVVFLAAGAGVALTQWRGRAHK